MEFDVSVPTKPMFYKRYVDDTYVRSKENIRDLLFEDLNAYHQNVKVGLEPSKKICVICFIESLSQMMKNAFYFNLKALFVLKIFKLLSCVFGHAGKTV